MATMKGNPIFSFFFFFFFLNEFSYSQTDTIQLGQELKQGMQLFSASGIFRLGFVQLGPSNFSYLGIWYNTRDNENPVWVANRGDAILDDSGALGLDQYGNLKITQNARDPITLYSAQASVNSSAVLLDSGNFALRESSPDGSVNRVLWQSFDRPTDTLLPKMKLGFDRVTGVNRSLTSWRSVDSPALGSFTLGLDPIVTDEVMVIWWRGVKYWGSGTWRGGCFDSLGDEFCNDYKYNFSYVSNENESYFSYLVSKEVTIFPRLTLSPDGEIRGYGMDFMFTGVSCIGSSSDSKPSLRFGCVEQELPSCRGSSSRDSFESKVGAMSRDGFRFNGNENLTMVDCREKCLKNCSCVAYAYADDNNGTGCEIWTKESSFTEINLATLREIHILESGVRMWWIWLMILVGGTATFPLLLSSLYVMWKKCKARSNIQRMTQDLLLQELGKARKRHKDGTTSNELHMFGFESISTATKGFSAENKLGEGGFGPVYRGQFVDGREVAIKRLSRSSGQGLVEFKNEALLIAKLQHTNLVRLLGFCIQREERILIYEYMPNKSLDFFLFDDYRKNLLTWEKRFSIIGGIAQGLVYLHKYSRLKVIHRDLKASNILLDKDMNPKISDFGMARIFGLNVSEVNTNRVVGTYGYMSPEYALNGIVSEKTDVFSFGIILLEIITGKKNNSTRYGSEEPLNLIGYAWHLWKEVRGFELLDPALVEYNEYNVTEVLNCIHIGLLCVQDHAADRPTVQDVVSMLSNDTTLLPSPKQPAFFISKIHKEGVEVSAKKSDKCSVNEITTSVMEAR
ncbi:Serine/threonine protein kinase [Parasponia andersonii]|uniref:Receptor-like serine/threonine-protein kinase n=1 Tax=Parasponia andersonii TaxID=3476 RepID=A0A2P5AEM1_PARAD|nr:Serine/threonine protein kinase [Parasponia andersonii]